MSKEIFIVNGTEGTKIVSARVLAADIRKKLENQSYKRCDVESISKDLVRDYKGRAVTEEDYVTLVNHTACVMTEYNVLTPYKYMIARDSM